ncbi:hypothetical protein HWV62_4271 [Athelia sp. TMB]|nr:hypothetical protein HWV62_14960 [Athelia sp. TMB]KAF7977298.1 hypothetical protein HWV62_4271 [Athelia sp. TMB]
MINKAPNDPYITAFYLHPGMYPNVPQSPIVALIIWPEYRGANIYSNINPLDVPEVRISISRSAASKVIPPEEQIATRIIKALGHMLMHEYGDTYNGKRSDEEAAEMMKSRNPRLAGILPRDAVVELKTQLADYRLRVDPFNRPIRAGETALAWWTSVQKNPHAQVLGALAIKLFSVVPNSMEDERTVSTITWLNSAARSCQEPEGTTPKASPSMKWRDVYANSLNNQPLDPSQRPVLTQPRAIPKNLRQEALEDPDSDTDSDTDDDVDEEGQAPEEDADITPPTAAIIAEQRERSRTAFNVGDHIDVTSPFLLDILSDTAIYSKQSTQPARSSTKRPAKSPAPSAPLKANEWF